MCNFFSCLRWKGVRYSITSCNNSSNVKQRERQRETLGRTDVEPLNKVRCCNVTRKIKIDVLKMEM